MVLIHAAAGGVGQILAVWTKSLGATVIGTVGSIVKFNAAKQEGCDVVVDYSNRYMFNTRTDICKKNKNISNLIF